MNAALAAPPDDAAPSPAETGAAPAIPASAPVSDTATTEVESAQPPTDTAPGSSPILTDDFDLADTTEPVETESNIAAPVVQPLPPREEPTDTASSEESRTTGDSSALPRTAPAAPTNQSGLPVSNEGPSSLQPRVATESGDGSPVVAPQLDSLGNAPAAPLVSDANEDESASMLWWFLALIAVAIFGVLGWTYTRRRTAPSAVIERPTIAGAGALRSIEDAKLALTLDVISATKSLRMFTVEYRLRVANRSARALRELAMTPELSSARKGDSEQRGPAVAHGTGETVRIDRIGPHQSEVITGTVQLPIADIRPLLQGSKPLFVPLLKVQLRLPSLPPAEHIFIIGLPSATSAARLHPLELDTPPGGLPRLETRKIDS